MQVLISDQVLPGTAADTSVLHITLQPGVAVTARDILRSRIAEEASRRLDSPPPGPVAPQSEVESLLNAPKPAMYPDAQLRRACNSFEKNGFLILIDGEQVTDLDTPVTLHDRSEIVFLKLVPLIGG